MGVNAGINFKFDSMRLHLSKSMDPKLIYFSIGRGYDDAYMTAVIDIDTFKDMAEQWMLELTAMTHELFDFAEADAHAADGTLDDLVFGSDEGGRQ